MDERLGLKEQLKNSVIILQDLCSTVEMNALHVQGVLELCEWMFCIVARKYDAFVASDSLIKQIPRLLGPGLNRAGKFPTLVTHNDNLKQKIDEVKATIRFQMKKVRESIFIGYC